MSRRAPRTVRRLRKRIDNPLTFLLITIGVAILLILYLGQSRHAALRAHQAELGRQSVEATSHEIALLIRERRRSVQLFIEENLAPIRQLATGSGNGGLYAGLLVKVERHFPDLVAYMITDQDGRMVLDTTGQPVGEACRRGIRTFSRDGGHVIKLHATPRERYLHFDVMLPVALADEREGVFLASFRTHDLVRLLNSGQVHGHRLLLVDADHPQHIEMTAQGDRGSARNADGWVNDADPGAAYSLPIPDTGWRLVDRLEPSLVRDMAFWLWSEMLAFLALFSGLGVVMCRRIGAEERRRALAETALQCANETLEQRVRERTGALTEANARLAHEMAERRNAEQRDRLHLQELCHVTRLSTMGEMASALAHEINQPLAAIANYANGCMRRLQGEAGDPRELREVMTHVVAQSEQAGAVIRRLRQFLRKGEVRATAVDLDHVIRDAIGLIEPEARKQTVTLSYRNGRRVPAVMADGIQIEQVLLNLVRNGIEAIARGAAAERCVTIEAAQTDTDTVTVSVSDSGPGLPPQLFARLFEPFLTTKPEGMGLGLSISRSIVETLGGRLWTERAETPGAVFRFTLPVQRL